MTSQFSLDKRFTQVTNDLKHAFNSSFTLEIRTLNIFN